MTIPMRLNDEERRLWVLNDEPLYRWFRSERGSLREFIRRNRAEISRIITERLDGKPWG